MTTAPEFTALRPDELEIDQPTFKAGKWKPSGHAGVTEYCECYNLIDGRWEGHVSLRRVAR